MQVLNDISKEPFQIKLSNIGEIRMGSPYKSCNIELIGFDKVKLPIASWQDKYTWSDNFKTLLLIKWDFEDNNPGFHLFFIDTETGQTKESVRIFGLPNSVLFEAGKIKINKFLYDKEKSKSGNLCCNVEEEFDFLADK